MSEPTEPTEPTEPAAPADPAPPTGPPPGGRSPMLFVLAGLAAGLLVALIAVVVISLGGSDEPAPAPTTIAEPTETAEPSPIEEPSPTDIASIEPIEPTETEAIEPPPVSKARVDGLYDGQYDFIFKPNCKQGPCGGLAQSGARFQIPYNGSSTYRGHSTLRDTCADGGVHVQAPYKVDLEFRPTDGAIIGNDWVATKVDVSLTIHRNAVVKKVRTSPTIVTTLTCDAYRKNYRWTGIRAI